MRRILEPIGLLLFTLLFLEIGLRLAGFKPLGSPKDAGFISVMAPDPVTGWRLATGTHELPGAVATLTSHVRVLPDGTRASSDSESADGTKPLVLLLGDSFIQGYRLDDPQVLGWLLQQARPDLEVRNFGTGGFGTCQSWLRLRELMEKYRGRKATVIYGFGDFHEARNIAHPLYVWESAMASTSRKTPMPVCSQDEHGHAVASPPEVYEPLFPFLTEQLALGRVAASVYYRIKALPRERTMRAVTMALIERMRTDTEAAGWSFEVLLMRADPEAKAAYVSFFQTNKIPFVDGMPSQREASSLLLDDGHPNAELNARWATQILAEMVK